MDLLQLSVAHNLTQTSTQIDKQLLRSVGCSVSNFLCGYLQQLILNMSFYVCDITNISYVTLLFELLLI